MKKMFMVIFLILFFIGSFPAHAEMKKLGQAGMTFLNVGGSARASAMADVFGFVKNDLSSVFYNPAGLASVEGAAFYLNQTQWIADMSVSNVAVSYNAEKFGVFALTLQSMNYGDFNGTMIADNAMGYSEIDVGDVGALSVGLSYGAQMTDKFAIGGGVRLISQNLGQNDTYIADSIEDSGKKNELSSFAVDFGTLYDTGIRSLQLSMSIRNYSKQQLYENEEFQLPQTYKIGIAANVFELFPLGVDGEENCLMLAVEGVDSHDRSEYVNAGLEYTLMDALDLRTGYSFQRAEDDAGGINAGAGLLLGKFLPFSGRLDVSYSDFGAVLGSVMRFSIQGSF